MNISNFKTPLILVIIGAAIVIIGALFKIMHLGVGPLQGNTLILVGGVFEMVAAVLVIVKLLSTTKK